jgi:hypothetical protein
MDDAVGGTAVTESSDATPAREELRACMYCDKTGADCYVRRSATGTSLFAHDGCAKARGVRPLYRLTDQATTPVVFPWA